MWPQIKNLKFLEVTIVFLRWNIVRSHSQTLDTQEDYDDLAFQVFRCVCISTTGIGQRILIPFVFCLSHLHPGLRIRSDIDRNRIQPLRTNRIRIHAFFKDRIRIQTLCLENFPSILWWVLIRNCCLFHFLTVLSHKF